VPDEARRSGDEGSSCMHGHAASETPKDGHNQQEKSPR
jgi:hypothetical protein